MRDYAEKRSWGGEDSLDILCKTGRTRRFVVSEGLRSSSAPADDPPPHRPMIAQNLSRNRNMTP